MVWNIMFKKLNIWFGIFALKIRYLVWNIMFTGLNIWFGILCLKD